LCAELRKKEERESRSILDKKKKLKIKRKKTNNPIKESIFSLQGIPSNFDRGYSLMSTPFPLYFIF
jgi:hypothetical protein